MDIEKSNGVFGSLQAFEDGQRIAKVLAASKLVPDTFKNNIGDCLIAMEMANRMGANPLAVMQNLYIVHGKPSWSSTFIIAAINQSGRFKTTLMFEESGEGENKSIVAYAIDHDENRVESPSVSIKMAKEEGWFQKKGSKWQTMPDLMLRYRAATFFGRLYTPDLLMGLQTQEEIIDVKDSKTVKVSEDTKDLNQILMEQKKQVDEGTGEVTEAEVEEHESEEEHAHRIQLRKILLKAGVDRAKAFEIEKGLSDEVIEQYLADPASIEALISL